MILNSETIIPTAGVVETKVIKQQVKLFIQVLVAQAEQQLIHNFVLNEPFSNLLVFEAHVCKEITNIKTILGFS